MTYALKVKLFTNRENKTEIERTGEGVRERQRKEDIRTKRNREKGK